ncbi:MAG: hypothetical protein JSW61_02425 [Candidatus Thorarchaeota archaeon]|nr:MAG: hypothetical protein JSW61_02425 [Candidatus Thorarchaeota archaeon]
MKLERNVNSHKIVFEAKDIGKDLLIAIFGGDEHHIGGVAIAYPTESHYRTATTVSLSSMAFPGHKDYVVANTAAEKIAKALETPTVVAVGIHIDNAPWETIEAVIKAVDELVDEFIAQYGKPE